jgi:hypothetical protein
MRQPIAPIIIGAGFLAIAGQNLPAQSDSSSAQGAGPFDIRVEAREVVVPVYVDNKNLHCFFEPHGKAVHRAHPTPNLPMDLEISGLAASDFHIFEDGAEQQVRSLSVEPLRLWGIDDSGEASVTRETDEEYINYEEHRPPYPKTGHALAWPFSPGAPCEISHMEYASTPRGFWSGRDMCFSRLIGFPMADPSWAYTITNFSPAKNGRAGTLHLYLLSYVPPPSTKGSCHQIKVTTDRADASVYARDQYCSMHESSFDPLKGTNAEEQMGAEAASAQEAELPLSVQAAATFNDASTSRVNIAVEFPWRALNVYWDGNFRAADVDLLGLVYNQDGTLAVRFSDVAYTPKTFDFFKANSCYNQRDYSPKEFTESRLPTRYETQIDLPRGNYNLRIVVTDGTHFGRADVPFTVENYDAKNLSLSGIVLGKRFVNLAAVWPEPAAGNDTAAQPNPPKRELSTAPEYVPLVSNGIGITPAGDTGVPAGDQLLTYFEVYEPLLTAQQVKVSFRMRVIDEKTGQLQVGTDWRPANAPARPGSSIIPITEEIAAGKLTKGSYRLEIQASDSAGKKTDWRAASFTVE